VTKILEAVPGIRKEGMHALLRDPTRWQALYLIITVSSVCRNLRDILKDIGYKDAAGANGEQSLHRSTSSDPGPSACRVAGE
jgi:hypothetical protein